METIKRDNTKDLFSAVLQLVKDNGHYAKAEAIMDYYLPNKTESNVREDIALTNYEFDFCANVQFGGSEGIYINCYLSGKYTEEPLKVYNHSRGELEVETRRHIGSFKTLRDDLEAMMIMGELCGALTYFAHQYVNKNIQRYTPTKELQMEQKRESAKKAAGEAPPPQENQ